MLLSSCMFPLACFVCTQKAYETRIEISLAKEKVNRIDKSLYSNLNLIPRDDVTEKLFFSQTKKKLMDRAKGTVHQAKEMVRRKRPGDGNTGTAANPPANAPTDAHLLPTLLPIPADAHTAANGRNDEKMLSA